ncbi:tryptophan--tRNA ligase [Balamuthia mandrillaris]
MQHQADTFAATTATTTTSSTLTEACSRRQTGGTEQRSCVWPAGGTEEAPKGSPLPIEEEEERPEEEEESRYRVTPQGVTCSAGSIDYQKLIRQFGCKPIDPALLHRLEELALRRTGKPLHPFLKRGIFYSHKDLDLLLDDYEASRDGPSTFYLYTGRGPSSRSMHLGHLLPFLFTRYLQQLFDVPVVIQLTDDEKYLFRENLTLSQIRRNLEENRRDIIACGFDPQKTLIFNNLDHMGLVGMYPNVVRIQRALLNSQVRALFGVVASDNVGRTAFPAIQAAPAFASSFPFLFGEELRRGIHRKCLIPCGIDQDPYFRMTRELTRKLNHAHLLDVEAEEAEQEQSKKTKKKKTPTTKKQHQEKDQEKEEDPGPFKKPALIHSKFFPSLRGPLHEGKMSASHPDSVIFLDDTPKQLRRKIFTALSGGRTPLEEHRRLGADLTVDVPFLYLSFFLEDEEQLEQIRRDYGSGTLLSGQVKQRCYEVLLEVLREHQQRKASITPALVAQFTDYSRSFCSSSSSD